MSPLTEARADRLEKDDFDVLVGKSHLVNSASVLGPAVDYPPAFEEGSQVSSRPLLRIGNGASHIGDRGYAE